MLIQECNDFKTKDLIKGHLVLDTGEVYKSDFKPGFVELSSIGIVACNNRWFDVGIQWLQQAFKVCVLTYVIPTNKNYIEIVI